MGDCVRAMQWEGKVPHLEWTGSVTWGMELVMCHELRGMKVKIQQLAACASTH